MTVDPARLLQLLEPAVRPGAAATDYGQQAGVKPFESRSFQELLSEAGQPDQALKTPTDPAGEEARTHHPLGGLERIENAALRGVLASAAAGREG